MFKTQQSMYRILISVMISAMISAVYAIGDVKGMFDYDGVFLGRDASQGSYIRSLVQKFISCTY
jgi:hypothetical protein